MAPLIKRYQLLLDELKADLSGWYPSLMPIIVQGRIAELGDDKIKADIIAHSPERITSYRHKEIDDALKNCRVFGPPIYLTEEEHKLAGERCLRITENIQKEKELREHPPRFSDFAAIIADGLKAEKPTICEALPGLCLLYKGRVNAAHGEPSVGKTNINLCIASQIMRGGGAVLFLDPEDNPAGIASRFLSLGGREEDLLERFRYVHNPEPEEFSGLHEWAKENPPELVVLDGLAEALASEGYNEDVAGDILQFFRERIRPFADAGAAVLISDHVTKSKDGQGRWARGSGAKLGRYDGASYEVRLMTPYSPEIPGSVRLVVAKDRCGGVGPMGAEVADLVFAHDEDGNMSVSFQPPAAKERKEFVPTAIMEKISRFIEQAGDASKRDLRGLGKHEYVDQAVCKLVELGHLGIERKGQTALHKIIKPFREIGGKK